MNQRSLFQRFVSALIGAAILAAAAACGGGGGNSGMMPAFNQPASTDNAQRDAALTTLKASESVQRSAQDWGGHGQDDDKWSNCPPSGKGDDGWPNGNNWWWDGQSWWHWTKHHWCKDQSHDSNCPGSGSSGSGSGGSSGGGTTTTTTAYDSIAGLALVAAGGVAGVLTNAKGGVAAAYVPATNQTLLLAAVNLPGTCTDPGPTTQSSVRSADGSAMIMAGAAASSTPAPTPAPSTSPLPNTVCEIVMYTNDANPVVVDGPGQNDALNGTLDFLGLSSVTLIANDTYTFYLVYPVTTTTTTGGGGSGSTCTPPSQQGCSYWDGGSWWTWSGGKWCHNQTPVPTCTPGPTPTPGGDRDHDHGGDGDGGWG